MRKFVIADMPAPLPQALLDRYAAVDTATVGHFRHWGFIDPGIRPLGAVRRVIGTAVTLALPAQDSTLLHHALGLLKPGHIVVIDRLGDQRHACWGGGVTRAAHAAGASGAIVDGMCTDPHEIAALDFPVWCRGISPVTTRIQGLGGMLNCPVSCGGAVVNPGDLVLCDENGILVLPPGDIEGVADAALERVARGVTNRDRLNHGALLGDVSGATDIVLRDASL
jgi:4-hydroxy-4-methyl-2-oxoglutarate aldolase